MYNMNLFVVAAALFFAAFSIQESLLQSLISKYAKAQNRGAVIGDFSAAGFAGSFVGAIIGGFFSDYAIVLLNLLLISGKLISTCLMVRLFYGNL